MATAAGRETDAHNCYSLFNFCHNNRSSQKEKPLLSFALLSFSPHLFVSFSTYPHTVQREKSLCSHILLVMCLWDIVLSNWWASPPKNEEDCQSSDLAVEGCGCSLFFLGGMGVGGVLPFSGVGLCAIYFLPSKNTGAGAGVEAHWGSLGKHGGWQRESCRGWGVRLEGKVC